MAGNYFKDIRSMNMDENDKEYIHYFSEKQGITFIEMVEPGLIKFSDNHYFELDDIKRDIDENIRQGIALDYSREGLNGGILPDYKDYIKDKK